MCGGSGSGEVRLRDVNSQICSFLLPPVLLAKIVPKLYYVPESVIETASQTSQSSRHSPATMQRVPSKEHQPFLWAQALYIMARLLSELCNTRSGLHHTGVMCYAAVQGMALCQLMSWIPLAVTSLP